MKNASRLITKAAIVITMLTLAAITAFIIWLGFVMERGPLLPFP